jgi:hypothetical protein
VDGWTHLKAARKQAVFKGIVGALSCPEAELAWLDPPWARLSLNWQPSANETDPAAEPPAVPGPSRCQADADHILAEMEKAGPGSEDPQHLKFGGVLEMADNLALSFQLASQGKLQGVKARKNAMRESRLFPLPKLRLGNPGRLPWERPRARSFGPVPQAIYDVERGEGESTSQWRRRRPGLRFRTAEEASTSAGPSEEVLAGEWPKWAEFRENLKYAVVALDEEKAEQLNRYLQDRRETGESEMDSWLHEKGTTVGEKAATVIDAAVHKGQGLVLTVEEVDEFEYHERRDLMGERYFAYYGKHPYGILRDIEQGLADP